MRAFGNDSLQPLPANYRTKRENGRSFLGLDGDGVMGGAILRVPQKNVDGLYDFMPCFLPRLTCGAHDYLIIAAVASAKGNFLELRRAGDFLLGPGFAVNPKNVHPRAAFEFIEPLAEGRPGRILNFLHKFRVECCVRCNFVSVSMALARRLLCPFAIPLIGRRRLTSGCRIEIWKRRRRPKFCATRHGCS